MIQVGGVFVGLVATVLLLVWLSEMQWASDLRYWLFRLINKRATEEKLPVVSLPVLDKGSTRGPSVPRHYMSMPVRDMFLAQRFERLPSGEPRKAARENEETQRAASEKRDRQEAPLEEREPQEEARDSQEAPLEKRERQEEAPMRRRAKQVDRAADIAMDYPEDYGNFEKQFFAPRDTENVNAVNIARPKGYDRETNGGDESAAGAESSQSRAGTLVSD